MKKTKLTAQELDEKFDAGKEDILDEFELVTRKVNVDFPKWVIDKLDHEAKRLGITRQSLIKFWIAEKIDNIKNKKSA
ncbi:MAG: CopG family transcriptional regulator [Bdellovibrionales bacterium RIFOXYB1_FULL_37_110]|nr:MAG: CopG family transcriptional regulator [Bdellovibrionales bacterium RIFOXYC1_FULL_37_79]OFZ59120.1 MAG: CopG family transcriptional regulator [Bdellovibrionales bacterium RIFOXYB1_FULL_37_110]OFZ64125.1 MAG: CopG family transcriptional regulator [Bdellovibrionales bacterium RIFOXYD1_FULL_36_51]